MDLPNKTRGCHRTGFSTLCRDLVVDGKCDRWMQVQGKNPNTGEEFNRSNCIDDWGPLLMMENSQMQRQTGAAVESFRNEMVDANATALRLAVAMPSVPSMVQTHTLGGVTYGRLLTDANRD